MTWSFPIGRVFGSEIRIHATFFLLLAWIAVGAYLSGGPGAAAASLAFILALFACVVLHELGHALMARRYGIQTPDITLLPIGGLARLERMPEDPGQEIAVALAGPAVNLAIWALLILFGAGTDLEAFGDPATLSETFFAQLAAVNLILVLFNLIPAFPMDGGRVFRALLSMRMGRVEATRAAARAGQVTAFGFGLLGLLSGNVLLLLVAIFVFMAAGAESSEVALQDLARHLRARDAMITTYDSLAPDDRLDTAAQALIRTTQHEFPVLGPGGGLEGVLTREAIFAAVSEDRLRAPVSEAMTRDIPAVALTAPLAEALDAFQKGSPPAVAVTDKAGHFLGYITRENIGELMVVRGQR